LEVLLDEAWRVFSNREEGYRQGQRRMVAGVLTVDPPYGPEECSSSNEIILSRVQGLIQGYLEKQQ